MEILSVLEVLLEFSTFTLLLQLQLLFFCYFHLLGEHVLLFFLLVYQFLQQFNVLLRFYDLFPYLPFLVCTAQLLILQLNFLVSQLLELCLGVCFFAKLVVAYLIVNLFHLCLKLYYFFYDLTTIS